MIAVYTIKRGMTAILLCAVSIGSYAQNPGGVQGSLKWHKDDAGITAVAAAKRISVNHHAARKLDAADAKSLGGVALSGTRGLTFVAVCMGDSTKERTLWSAGGSGLLQTTGRTANLRQGTFLNYDGAAASSPQLFSYTRHTPAADTSDSLYIGQAPGGTIPALNFSGCLPEYAVYGRRLSTLERHKVESYLALKYGITLSQNYLNSRGEKVWDASKHKKYVHAVAGVVRDDASGLDQRISGSTVTPGLLEVAVADTLPDGAAYVWGDNNGALKFERKRGAGKWLVRKWSADATALGEKTGTLRFAACQLTEMYPLADGEQYYLAVDGSGTGKYPATSTRYYRAADSKADTLTFSGIALNTGGADGDCFSLRAEPDMFLAIDTVQPCCTTGQAGSITARIVGGTAPFTLKLMRGDEVVATRTQVDSIFIFNNLEQDTYRLFASDNLKKSYTEEFLLANSDIAGIPEFEAVTLKEGDTRTLNASDGVKEADYTYLWENPNGQTTGTPEISLSENGLYALTVTNVDGCTTRRTVEVTVVPNSDFRYCMASPNPTVDGHVLVKVQLVSAGTLTATLYGAGGQTCGTQTLNGGDFYSFDCFLPAKGTFILDLNNGGEAKRIKLIRK